MKCNQSHPGFELVTPWTITPRAPKLSNRVLCFYKVIFIDGYILPVDRRSCPAGSCYLSVFCFLFIDVSLVFDSLSHGRIYSSSLSSREENHGFSSGSIRQRIFTKSRRFRLSIVEEVVNIVYERSATSGSNCHCPASNCLYRLLYSNWISWFLQFQFPWSLSIEINVLFCTICSIHWRLPYLPTPLLGQDMTQGQFLSGV